MRRSWCRSITRCCPRSCAPRTRCAPVRHWSMTARPTTPRSPCAWAMPTAVEPAFARAHHVTRLSLYNNRVTAVTMEPRGCIAELRSRHPPLYALQQHAECARRPPDPGASDPACPGKPHPRDRPRCRRRLWHEGPNLSRGGRRRLGCAPRRPAGQMDPVAHGGVARRQSGARPERSTPNWRSTRMAGSWHCAGPECTMPAPISRRMARSRSCFR